MSDIQDTKLATLTLIDKGLIELKFKFDEYEVDVLDQVELQKAVSKLTHNGETACALVVIPGRHGGMTTEAREMEMFESKPFSGLKGLAIVTKALHQRLLGNLFLRFKRTKPTYPFKIFKSREEAIRWLKKI